LVRQLIADGFEVWWFDGDRDAALQLFLERTGHPATIHDHRRYMKQIEDNWDTYSKFFEDRRLDVISPGPILMFKQESISRD
jgi:ribosome maturation factor RimP